MRQRLSAAQVTELAELLEEAPRRTGVIDDVLQAAAEGRGMTLVLADVAEWGPGVLAAVRTCVEGGNQVGTEGR